MINVAQWGWIYIYIYIYICICVRVLIYRSTYGCERVQYTQLISYRVRCYDQYPFLCLARSKLRRCSANHRAGYFSWAYSEQDTENGLRFGTYVIIPVPMHVLSTHHMWQYPCGHATQNQRHYYVKTTSRRRFDVITTLLLRHVYVGYWQWQACRPSGDYWD